MLRLFQESIGNDHLLPSKFFRPRIGHGGDLEILIQLHTLGPFYLLHRL